MLPCLITINRTTSSPSDVSRACAWWLRVLLSKKRVLATKLLSLTEASVERMELVTLQVHIFANLLSARMLVLLRSKLTRHQTMQAVSRLIESPRKQKFLKWVPLVYMRTLWSLHNISNTIPDSPLNLRTKNRNRPAQRTRRTSQTVWRATFTTPVSITAAKYPLAPLQVIWPSKRRSQCSRLAGQPLLATASLALRPTRHPWEDLLPTLSAITPPAKYKGTALLTTSTQPDRVRISRPSCSHRASESRTNQQAPLELACTAKTTPVARQLHNPLDRPPILLQMYHHLQRLHILL